MISKNIFKDQMSIMRAGLFAAPYEYWSDYLDISIRRWGSATCLYSQNPITAAHCRAFDKQTK